VQESLPSLTPVPLTATSVAPVPGPLLVVADDADRVLDTGAPDVPDALLDDTLTTIMGVAPSVVWTPPRPSSGLVRSLGFLAIGVVWLIALGSLMLESGVAVFPRWLGVPLALGVCAFVGWRAVAHDETAYGGWAGWHGLAGLLPWLLLVVGALLSAQIATGTRRLERVVATMTVVACVVMLFWGARRAEARVYLDNSADRAATVVVATDTLLVPGRSHVVVSVCLGGLWHDRHDLVPVRVRPHGSRAPTIAARLPLAEGDPYVLDLTGTNRYHFVTSPY
jgi:hypothetical protein